MNILDQTIPQDQPQKARVWSPYQTAVFDAVKNPDEPILIQAVAGSGKSTTLQEAVNHTPGSTIMLAFNKPIADELKTKVHCDVKTLNALGWRQLKDHIPWSNLNEKKSLEVLKMIMTQSDYEEFGFTLKTMIGLAKNNCFGIGAIWKGGPHTDEERPVFPVPQEDFEDLLDANSDVPSELLPKFADICSRALFQCMSDMTTHDFNDQLYYPLLKGWSYPRYQNVFIDECQDLSPIQHMMLEAMQNEGARIVAVGDRHQAIYGFRGACTDSMDLLKKKFGMTELPLSISYRCSQAVVRTARNFCDTIQFREGAPIGSVTERAGEDPGLFPSGQLIVCRNNAPLFKAILRHVRAKEPCHVLTNFLDSFSSFVRSFKAKETKDLRTKLDKWFQKEVDAAKKRGFKGKVAGLTDKYETLVLFCEEFQYTIDILDLLKRLSLGHTGPTFATIHKSKGLEAQSVYFLRPDLCPSKWASGEDALRQEANLQYVGITRSALDLTFGARLEP